MANTWHPPAELIAPPPRRVGMKIFPKALILVATIAWPAMSIYKASPMISDIKKEISLNRYGHEISAKIIKLGTYQIRETKHYDATYEYETEDSNNKKLDHIQFIDFIPYEYYKELKIGSMITTIYSIHDPEISTLKYNYYNNPMKIFSFINIIIILTIIGIPIGVNGYVLTIFLKERRILKYGQIIEAEICGEYEYAIRSGLVSLVNYSFKDNKGNIILSQRDDIPAKSRLDYADVRGNFLNNPTVIFDPENSSKNMLYPPSMAKLL